MHLAHVISVPSAKLPPLMFWMKHTLIVSNPIPTIVSSSVVCKTFQTHEFSVGNSSLVLLYHQEKIYFVFTKKNEKIVGHTKCDTNS